MRRDSVSSGFILQRRNSKLRLPDTLPQARRPAFAKINRDGQNIQVTEVNGPAEPVRSLVVGALPRNSAQFGASRRCATCRSTYLISRRERAELQLRAFLSPLTIMHRQEFRRLMRQPKNFERFLSRSSTADRKASVQNMERRSITILPMLKAENLRGIGRTGVEQTFGPNPDNRSVPYGSKGSVRTDVVLRNDIGDVIAIYDVKTGSAKLGPLRVQGLREKTDASPRIPIIEMHIQRGLSLKARTGHGYSWIITLRLWNPWVRAMSDRQAGEKPADDNSARNP